MRPNNFLKDLFRTLKALAVRHREISLIDIGKYDQDYEDAMNQVIELDRERESLALEPEAAETIGKLLEAFGTAEAEQVNLAYLAGMADCLLILDRLAESGAADEEGLYLFGIHDGIRLMRDIISAG